MRATRVLDLLGPAAFAITYLASRDFTAATWAIGIGAAVALVLRYRLDGRLAPLSAVLGLLAVATSLLALVLGSETILEAQPTFVHLLVGSGLVASWLLDGRPAKSLLGGAIELTDRAWATLCLRFGLLDIALGLANEVIRRTATSAMWALFHFPGTLLVHMAFLATQLPLLLAARREVTERPHDAPP